MCAADLPLSQVKLGELGSWFSRRSYTPQAMTACAMRGTPYSRMRIVYSFHT